MCIKCAIWHLKAVQFQPQAFPQLLCLGLQLNFSTLKRNIFKMRIILQIILTQVGMFTFHKSMRNISTPADEL